MIFAVLVARDKSKRVTAGADKIPLFSGGVSREKYPFEQSQVTVFTHLLLQSFYEALDSKLKATPHMKKIACAIPKLR